MSLDRAYDMGSRHIPKPDDMVIAAGGQRPPIFAQSDAMDAVLRFLQEDLRVAAFFGKVKYLGRLIGPASGHALAIRTEDHLQNTGGMSRNHLRILPGPRVPNAHGMVAGSRCQGLAIGAIGHGENRLCVALELPLAVARGDFEYFHHRPAGHRNALPVRTKCTAGDIVIFFLARIHGNLTDVFAAGRVPKANDTVLRSVRSRSRSAPGSHATAVRTECQGEDPLTVAQLGVAENSAH